MPHCATIDIENPDKQPGGSQQVNHFIFSLALRYTQQTVAEKPTKRTQEPNKWKPETWHIGKQAVYDHVTKRASGFIFFLRVRSEES
jgi:hypothetical protein